MKKYRYFATKRAKKRAAIICREEGAKLKENTTRKTSSSAWDEGILVVDYILNPSSPTNATLSDSQKEALEKVREILLKGNQNQINHIPDELQRRASLLDSDTCSLSYILSEFAGEKRVSSNEKWKNAVLPQIFISKVRKAMEESSGSFFTEPKEGSLSYLLPEWENLSLDMKPKVAEILSWESLSTWNFDIFEVEKLTDGKALLFVGWAILCSPHAQYAMQTYLAAEGDPHPPFLLMEGYRFIDMFKIPQMALCNFLRATMGDYNDNAYHNSTHGADVLQSVNSILIRMDGRRHSSADLDLFSVLLAAAIHDVNHPGRTNSFLVNSKSDLALLYNDESVLESMHVSSAFARVMGRKKEKELDIFEFMEPNWVSLCRERCIDAILHTDMSKHFTMVGEMKGRLMKYGKDSDKSVLGWEAMPYILHLADISNQAKHISFAVQWTDRLLEESFNQGDEERELDLPYSPLCSRTETDRAGSQVNFIKYLVQPSFEVLGMMIPTVREEVNSIIESNLNFWETEQTTRQT